MGSVTETKPHAVLLPFPAQGHVNPMLNVAKLLHFRGFHITFVNTEFNHKRLLRSKGSQVLESIPHFKFETIPDGLPPSDIDVNQDVPPLCFSTGKTCLVPFRALLARLNQSASAGLATPVSCIVADGSMSFSVQAAEELDIPIVLFWTTSACGFLGYAHFKTLVEKGLTPLKDESDLTNGYLDQEVDCIKGMNNIRLRDLPAFIRTTDPDDKFLDYMMTEIERAYRASAIIINTVEEMESDALSALSSMFRLVFSIGPLNLLVNQIPENNMASLTSNFWKESECLQWLDSQETRSVIYVNFGSVTVMTSEQLFEFAWGLANTKKPFLWIIRPNLVKGGSVILSSEFVNEIKERGLIAGWCAQEQVLNHPSVGGFLTHSGWNSTIESVCAGVPMVCWPFFAEQQTNCRYACTDWGIGMEIDTDVKREEVEKLVNEIMEGEKGKEMKRKVMDWKKKADEATSPNGSSYINLDQLVKNVLLK